MLKKTVISITIIVLILALGSVSAVGAKGKPTQTPPPETPPADVPNTGELYGDLYVILRDVDGVPMLDENGCIQPIAAPDADGSVEIRDSTDTTIILFQTTAIAGEPFALAYYTDLAAELEVECELTEEMLDWVQAVDFGRLNLGRAPDAVIAHAFDEAINKMNVATEFALDPSGRIMMLIDDEWKTIDAPAENLALYIKMMQDGHWITTDTTPITKGGPPEGKGPPEGDGPSSEPRPVLSDNAISLLQQYIQYGNLGDVNNQLNNHDLLLAASLLAGAADKTGTMTLDKVVYINSIYGLSFDFSDLNGNGSYKQNRGETYGNRTSGECDAGWIWVLQPEEGVTNHYVTECVEILGYMKDGVAGVHFNDMLESYTTVNDADGDPLSYNFDDNVRGFVQSSDDALQVLEYIHNYKVPVDLYATE